MNGDVNSSRYSDPGNCRQLYPLVSSFNDEFLQLKLNRLHKTPPFFVSKRPHDRKALLPALNRLSSEHGIIMKSAILTIKKNKLISTIGRD